MRVLGIALMFLAAAVAPAAAADLGPTLSGINDRGAIRLGYRESSPPFSSVDKDKKPVGYSIDLCLAIADAVKERLGRPEISVQWVPLTAENRIDQVVQGAVDVECGNTTHTLSRQERVDFTLPTFITGGSLVLLSGSEIKDLAGFGGKKISVVGGTTTEQELRSVLQQNNVNAEVVVVKDHNEGMKMLEKKKVDAHAGDQLVLIGLVREAKNPKDFALVTDLFSYEPYALMVPRGDPEFRLTADRVLARLYRTGEIAAVYDKWFGDWGGRPSKLLLAMYALNGLPE